jgi:hypothetical protein
MNWLMNKRLTVEKYRVRSLGDSDLLVDLGLEGACPVNLNQFLCKCDLKRSQGQDYGISYLGSFQKRKYGSHLSLLESSPSCQVV